MENIVIDIAEEDTNLFEELKSTKNIECQLSTRSRLTGAEVVSIIASIAPIAIPIAWDVIRKYVKSGKKITIEWNGYKFENISEDNLEELFRLITNEKENEITSKKSPKKDKKNIAKKSYRRK